MNKKNEKKVVGVMIVVAIFAVAGIIYLLTESPPPLESEGFGEGIDTIDFPIYAYGEIYTLSFNDSVYNFSDNIDDLDRIINEGKITKSVTFTNYDDVDHRIYVKLKIPNQIVPYTKIYILQGTVNNSVTYRIDIASEWWMPVKANSNITMSIIYTLDRSPIGTVIDNYSYECFLQCSIECNYYVEYWDYDVPFEVWT